MKILVADDNVDNRQLLFDIFTAKGYRVVLAEDGLVTVEKAHTEMPDLIILDIAMPGMSGYEVCETLKSDPLTTHIPIVMLTALADVNNRVQGLGLGADDYLTKPFSSRELVARVETRLRAKATT
ncbi:MAG: DNA-binding response regulator, partial [Chloroflexi bacterium]